MRLILIVVYMTFAQVLGTFIDRCELPDWLKGEIREYQPVVDQIIDHVVKGPGKGGVYNAMVDFLDEFGPRLSGTKTLELAIQGLEDWAKGWKLKTSKEEVQVPYWTRGHESVLMLEPREAKLNVLGLGQSVSTPAAGIEAPALVVTSFEELREKNEEAIGKIVVLNPKWSGYDSTVKFRTQAAARAAEVGAVAVLIRSMTDLNMGVPHTGGMDYEEGIPKIPAACISVEDANMLLRMQQRQLPIVLRVKLQSIDHGLRTSNNLMVDVEGSDEPEKYVFVSGHTDSWDVGTGAMDDGGGAFISLFTPIILKQLGLQARRTVRALLFTSEEPGLYGAHAYRQNFSPEDIILAIESDEGVFNPTGLLMHGSYSARCIVHEILQLLKPINATTLETHPSPGSDISEWLNSDVPTAALRNDNERYFWYHHTIGDRPEVMDPGAMDRSLALFAAVTYVVADLKVALPRNKNSSDWQSLMSPRNPKPQDQIIDHQSLHSMWQMLNKHNIENNNDMKRNNSSNWQRISPRNPEPQGNTTKMESLQAMWQMLRKHNDRSGESEKERPRTISPSLGEPQPDNTIPDLGLYTCHFNGGQQNSRSIQRELFRPWSHYGHYHPYDGQQYEGQKMPSRPRYEKSRKSPPEKVIQDLLTDLWPVLATSEWQVVVNQPGEPFYNGVYEPHTRHRPSSKRRNRRRRRRPTPRKPWASHHDSANYSWKQHTHGNIAFICQSTGHRGSLRSYRAGNAPSFMLIQRKSIKN